MGMDRIRLMHALFLPAAGTVREAQWRPSTDIYRTPDGWLLKFDLAGVHPQDVELTLHGSRLTLRGTRRDWCIEEGCRHYQMEISYSHFERSVELPADLEHAAITTEHREGMLLVRIQLEAAQ